MEEMMDIEFAGFRLRPNERVVMGPHGEMELSARSVDILKALLSQPGDMLSKDELFNLAWPGLAVEENTLQVHVSALRKVIGSNLIMTVHGRGYKYVGPTPTTATSDFTSTTAVKRKPIVAVFPFDNQSGDPGQQYFSDGLTDDIIDRLSRYKIISVIGRHSTFALRGKEDTAAVTLAADYIVTGNVRRNVDRLRISARLTDARTATAIWAEHYDRPLSDIFAVQDEVTRLIASTLVGHVEIEAATHKESLGKKHLSSYEYVMKGMWQFRKLTLAANLDAADCFRKAIEEFPGNAQAYRWLASCENSMWLFEFSRRELVDSLRNSEKAIELDPASADCHSVHGYCQLMLGNLDAAEMSLETACRLNSGDPYVLANRGVLHAYKGETEIAYNYLDEAIRLNPLPPLWYAEWRAIALFSEGKYGEAAPAFSTIPDGAWDTMYALSCFAHLGDEVQVAKIKRRLKSENRKWDFVMGAGQEPFVNAETRRKLVAGIELASKG